jgi:hypothetical protein
MITARYLIGTLYLFMSTIHVSMAATENSTQTRDLNFYQSRNWFELGREQTQHYEYLLKKDKKQNDAHNVRLAKQALMSGDLERSRIYLSRVRDDNPYFQDIKRRYMAIISFLNKDYNKSLKYLDSNRLAEFSNYRHVCLLKLMNYTALKKHEEFFNEVRTCKSSIQHSDGKPENFFWLDQYTLLTTNRKKILSPNYIKGIKHLSGEKSYITKWLKLALFLNQEKAIIELVPRLGKEFYQSRKNRELIGFAYYRVGNKEMAKEFIEDIESPNADNIRGNINLDEGRFELAFGHFQLALKKKENSINALERSLPLAWQLGQWKAAQSLLAKLHSDQIDEKKKLALKTALLIRLNDFDLADRHISLLKAQYQYKSPIEVDLMNSYISLRKHDNDKLIKSADDACRKYDGLSCYILLQTLSWHNLGATIERKDSPYQNEFSVEKMKEKIAIAPLIESRYIDQREIEELDSRTIKVSADNK